MSITNEPIFLNQTGERMLEQMKIQNAYLSMLASGSRSQIFENVSEIARIIRNNSVDENKRIFPVGDQIMIPWKDMDDGSHNTDETAYQIPLNIVHHGEVTLESGAVVPGMFVQWHYCSPFGVQFSNYQAFMNCPDGLPAGQYYVTFNATWGSKDAQSGTSWNFTLTQNVPAGGRLSGFEGMPDTLSSSWKVKSWASPTAASPIETVSVVSGAEGTSLGSMNLTMLGDEGLNCMHSVGYGHNRWSTSAIRQYLNATGTGWWASKEDFDIRPNEYAKNGFMSGFKDDLLNAIKPIKVTTALNTVEGFSNDTEDTYDRFFLPSLEQMNVVPQLSGAEGEYFEYWRKRLGVNAPVAQYGTYPNFITTAINAQSSPQHVRLRSANRGNAYNAWNVDASGNVSNNGARNANRFAPVCAFC